MSSKTVCVPAVDFVSVLCWDASFREHVDALRCALNQTLPRDRYEVIFVEYYERVNTDAVRLAHEHGNLQVVALGNRHPGKENQHNIGACVNEGLRRARGDLVVLPDADVMFEEDFLEEVIRQHERVEELALYFHRLVEPKTDRPVPRTIEELKKVARMASAHNYGACPTVRTQWLKAVNGYDEAPVWRGYGGACVDAGVRFKSLGLCIKWHPTKFLYHGYHPGSAEPGAESRERIRIQIRIVEGREKALETLPTVGLDPSRKPHYDYDAAAETASRRWRLKVAARKCVRAVVPEAARHALRAVLSD